MDLVDFKMTKDGLVLVIKDYESIQVILDQIVSKLSQMKGFFAAGDKIMLMMERHEMHSHDIPRIVSLLRQHGIDVAQILIGEFFSERFEFLEQDEVARGARNEIWHQSCEKAREIGSGRGSFGRHRGFG